MTLKNTEDTNAVFKIINRQSFSDHDECIEITTEGKYYIKNGKHYLLYKEYDKGRAGQSFDKTERCMHRGNELQRKHKRGSFVQASVRKYRI